jgi:hypothetical protein
MGNKEAEAERGNPMGNQFREAEETFGRLRALFNERRISQREFIDTLKQLRIKDEDGKFWMIGAQTGKWYFFDGDDWVQAKPPSQHERKAICIYCGFENDLETETCVRCGSRKKEDAGQRLCPRCGAKLEDPDVACPACTGDAGAAQSTSSVPSARKSAIAEGQEMTIRSFHGVSFFWFFGVLGVFAGMLLGLLVGVTGFFPGLVAALPGFFADIQGKLLGGIVFTVAGGFFGFIVGGPAGFAAAAAANGVLSLVGGIKVLAVRAPGQREDKDRP